MRVSDSPDVQRIYQKPNLLLRSTDGREKGDLPIYKFHLSSILFCNLSGTCNQSYGRYELQKVAICVIITQNFLRSNYRNFIQTTNSSWYATALCISPFSSNWRISFFPSLFLLALFPSSLSTACGSLSPNQRRQTQKQSL